MARWAKTPAGADPMNTHCGWHKSLVFHGQVLGAEVSVSVCLEPGLHYGFPYGVPGRPLIAAFPVESRVVRGDFDWQRVGDTDWASLTLPFEGTSYTIRVSRPLSGDDLAQGRMTIAGRGADVTLVLDPGSIVSTLPLE
jgi:hypothetical protein